MAARLDAGAGIRLRISDPGASDRGTGDRRVSHDDCALAPRQPRKGDAVRLARYLRSDLNETVGVESPGCRAVGRDDANQGAAAGERAIRAIVQTAAILLVDETSLAAIGQIGCEACRRI